MPASNCARLSRITSAFSNSLPAPTYASEGDLSSCHATAFTYATRRFLPTTHLVIERRPANISASETSWRASTAAREMTRSFPSSRTTMIVGDTTLTPSTVVNSSTASDRSSDIRAQQLPSMSTMMIRQGALIGFLQTSPLSGGFCAIDHLFRVGIGTKIIVSHKKLTSGTLVTLAIPLGHKGDDCLIVQTEGTFTKEQVLVIFGAVPSRHCPVECNGILTCPQGTRQVNREDTSFSSLP